MKKYIVIILLQLVLLVEIYNSRRIENLHIAKCTNQNYPVTVSNVTVQLGTKKSVKISGTLSTAVDLIGPIKASVYLKRRIWGVWLPVPCTEDVGSCTCSNLCDYGYPANETCPKDFKTNNVPCRCPINKGNYTISPSFSFDVEKETSILSGTYKGSVTITQSGQFLSCYTIYFVFYDTDITDVTVKQV